MLGYDIVSMIVHDAQAWLWQLSVEEGHQDLAVRIN